MSSSPRITLGGAGPEIPFADGIPMPPPVRPVLVLGGSDHEIGYQYFQQLVQIYGAEIASQKWGYLYHHSPLHRDFSAEEKAALREFQAHVDRYAPEWTDIMEGMAAGARDAGIDLVYEDVLAYLVLFEEHNPWSLKSFVPASAGSGGGPGAAPGGGGGATGGAGTGSAAGRQTPACSGFAAWGRATKDGRLICAGNGDDPAGFFAHTVVVFPETGNSFIASPYHFPGFGTDPAHPVLNSKGVVLVHHGSGCISDTANWGYTVPRGMANMHILRFADTAQHAVEMHLALPAAVNYKDGNFFADLEHDVLVIERRHPAVIRRAGDAGETDFLYHTNNYQSQAMGDRATQDHIPHGGWLSKEFQGLEELDFTPWSVSRNLFMWNMLHNYQGEIDAEFAQMMYRFPSSITHSTLEEADAAYGPELGRSYHAHIGSLFNSFIGIALPHERRYLVCSGPATQATGAALPTMHNYGPGQTHSFYELTLGSGPQELAETALTRAQYDLYYANKALSGLKFAEAACLEPTFDRAKTEFMKGHYYLNSVLTGNVPAERDVLFHVARATRAFTRCQVYARQLREAVEPPASSPEDLGLRPWLGDWGEWSRY